MTEDEKKEEMSFAQLFEANPQTPGRGVTAGAAVFGEVVKIGKETIFVDLGGKSEGMVDIAELLDEIRILPLRKGTRFNFGLPPLGTGSIAAKKSKFTVLMPLMCFETRRGVSSPWREGYPG